MKGNSHCDACGHELSVIDLVPVIGWLSSGGKCRYCSTKISARHPLSEGFLSMSFLAIILSCGMKVETIELLVFAMVLLFCTLVDSEGADIPLPAAIVAFTARLAYLVYCAINGTMSIFPDIAVYAISAVGIGCVASLLFQCAGKLTRRPFANWKSATLLFALSGWYFGWQWGLIAVALGCLLNFVMALVLPGKKADAENEEEPDGGKVISSRDKFNCAAIAIACVIVAVTSNISGIW